MVDELFCTKSSRGHRRVKERLYTPMTRCFMLRGGFLIFTSFVSSSGITIILGSAEHRLLAVYKMKDRKIL